MSGIQVKKPGGAGFGGSSGPSKFTELDEAPSAREVLDAASRHDQEKAKKVKAVKVKVISCCFSRS